MHCKILFFILLITFNCSSNGAQQVSSGITDLQFSTDDISFTNEEFTSLPPDSIGVEKESEIIEISTDLSLSDSPSISTDKTDDSTTIQPTEEATIVTNRPTIKDMISKDLITSPPTNFISVPYSLRITFKHNSWNKNVEAKSKDEIITRYKTLIIAAHSQTNHDLLKLEINKLE